MNRPLRFLPTYIIVLFFVGLASIGYSQTPTSFKHEELDQQTVKITFNSALSGSTTTGQWSIKIINTAPSATTSIAPIGLSLLGTIFSTSINPVSGTDLYIRFNASALPGHTAATPFLLPTESVQVTFTNTGNTLTGVANFTDTPSSNNWIAVCTDVRYSSEGNPGGLDICAPVNTDFYRWTYAYTLRARNSSQWNTQQNLLNVQWGDPSSTASNLLGYRSDDAGNANANYYSTTSFTGATPGVLLTFRSGYNPVTNLPDGTNQFIYPSNVPTPTGVCNFDAVLYPFNFPSGSYFCNNVSTIVKTHTFASFDYDNRNTGALVLTPSSPSSTPPSVTSDKVCFGTNVGMYFTDTGNFNCIGNGTDLPASQGAQSKPVNTAQRWVRFIYGGFDSPTAQGNIRDIRVNGIPVTDPSTGALLAPYNTGNGILPGTYLDMLTPAVTPMPKGFVVTGSGGPGQPDSQGVIELNGPITSINAALKSQMITTLSTANHAVGQRFYVTVQHWNVCNPYDLGSAPVETSTFYVEIIDKPRPPAGTGSMLCYSTAAIPGGLSFTANKGLETGTITAVNWYKNLASVGTATKMVNPNGTNSFNFPVTAYGAQGGVGGAFTTNNVNGRYYSVWVTQVIGSANSCESDPVEVVIIQQPQINNTTDKPTTPVGDTDVCNGQALPAHVYTTTAPGAADKTIPITTSTNAAAVYLPTQNIWSTTFGTGITFTPATGNSTTFTFSAPAEPNPSTTANVSVQRQYITSTVITVTSPVLAPKYPIASYNISPLACINTKVDLSVKLWGKSSAGTITPTTQTICAGSTFTAISLGNSPTVLRGTVSSWEKSVNGGAFATDITLGNGTTMNTPAIPIVGGLQTIYRFQAIVQNGPSCNPATSGIATIIVNPAPTAAVISGDKVICKSDATDLIVTITGGTAPYSVTYSDGTSNFTVSPYTSGANISVSPLVSTTYTLVSVTDGATPSCPVPAAGLTGSAVVTISNPVSAVMSGDNSVCPPAPSNSTDIKVKITGGKSPYTVNYEDDLGNSFSEPSYISESNITLTNIATTRTYTIVSVFDANNCPSLSNTGSAVITVGVPPTSATFTGGGSYCLNSTVSLKLKITGGVSPFTVTITGINGGAPFSYVSEDPIPVPTNATGTIGYSATVVLDACFAPLPFAAISGNPQSVTITDLPIGADDDATPICSGAGVGYNLQTQNIDAFGNSIPSNFSWIATANANVGGESTIAKTTVSITDALINTTNSDQTVVYTVTPTSVLNSCPGASFKVSVVVHPTPVVPTPITASAICSGDNVSHNLQNDLTNNLVTSNFTWVAVNNTNVTGENTAIQTTNQINDALVNVTSSNQTVKYNASATSTNGCGPVNFVVNVVVHPEPVGFNSSKDICSGLQVNYNLQTQNINVAPGNSVASTFSWIVLTDNPAVSGESLTPKTTNIINDALTTTAATDQVVTYTVTPTSTAAPGCAGASFTIDVTVHPQADITIQPVDTPVCETGTTSTGTVSFSVTASGPGIAYQWQEKVPAGTFTNITDGVTYSGATSSTGILTITGVTAAMHNNQYQVVLTTTGSCPLISDVATLTVNPLPIVANPTINDLCSDTPGGNSKIGVDLTDYNDDVHSVAGFTFTWYTDAAALPASQIFSGTAAGQDGNYTIIDPGTDPVLYVRVHELATGCESIAAVTFPIRSQPLPNPINGPGTVCLTNSFGYTVTKHPGSTYSWTIPIEYTVAFGGGGVIPGGGPGPFTNEYSIFLEFNTLTAATGVPISVVERSVDNCDGPVNTFNIIVSPSPGVIQIENFEPPYTAATATRTDFCKGNTAVFQVRASDFNPSSTYIWSIENPIEPGSDATFDGAFSGTGLQQVIVKMGTKNSAIIKVTESNSICSGLPAQYPVNILDAPVMTLSTGVVCSGFEIADALDFSTLVTQASDFKWTIKFVSTGVTGLFVNDTGSSSDGLIHVPMFNITGANGTVRVEIIPTAKTGAKCIGQPVEYTITVKPEPVVNLVANQSVCPLSTVNGSVTFPLGSNVPGATIHWASSNPLIGLAAPIGTGNINFTAADNLTGVDIVSIITVTADATLCSSSPANSKTFTITVKPRPDIDPITDITACPGDPISPPLFKSNTTGETYEWTNDNTAIGLGTSGSGNIGGFFAGINNTGSDIVGNISVKATLAFCEGPVQTFKIIIHPQPVVTGVTDREYCEGETISINLGSNVPTATINWTNDNPGIGVLASGTGSPLTGTAPVNTTGADIVGKITVTAVDDCTSQGANIKTFFIRIKPTPQVTQVADIEVCSGVSIPAIAFGSNIPAGGVTYAWENDNTAINLPALGNGTIGSFTAAVNTSGVPIVATIKVTGTRLLCSGPPMFFKITVKPEPVVDGISIPPYCPGDLINIPLTSIPATATINWTNSNPSIGLASTGTGDIVFNAPNNTTGSTITATIVVTASENGCTSGTGNGNAKTFQIVIKPSPVTNDVTDVEVCSGKTIPSILFGANTGGGEVFDWTNDNIAIGQPLAGSGNIASYTAPVNVGSAPIIGIFKVHATINGCAGPDETFRITVKPEPVVDGISDGSFCAGESISFPLTSTNLPGASFTWTNTNTLIGLGIGGNGDIGYTAPVNTTGVPITGTITVKAALDGCTSAGANIKSFTITIKPTPLVDPVSIPAVCSEGTIPAINFGSNVVSGGVTFNWTNDNPAINLPASGTGNIPSFTAALNLTNAPIVANISVTGKKGNCEGPPRTFTITINPKPVIVSGLNHSICSNSPTGLILSTIPSGVAAVNYNVLSRTSVGLTTVSAAVVPALGVSSIYLNADKFRNTTNAPLDVEYKVRAVGAIGGCIGDIETITITVDPEPKAPVTTTIERCSGIAINYDIQSAIDDTANGGNALANSQFTYVISSVLPNLNDLSPAAFPANFGRDFASMSDAPISETFQNFTNHDVTITYTITPYSEDPDRCAGTPFELKVVYHPEPVGKDFEDPLCATTLDHDIQTQIFNAIQSEFTYTVSSDNAGVPAGPDRTMFGSAHITDTYVNNTGTVANMTYTITARAIAAPNCGSTALPPTFKYVAKIFPTPEATPLPLVAACSDESVTINPQTFVTNSVTITKYDWKVTYPAGLISNGTLPTSGTTTPNATGNIVFTMTNKTAGSLSVTLDITPYAGGCPGSVFTIVKPIDAEPVMSNSLSTSQCSGVAYGINLATDGVYAGAVTYDVYVDDVPTGLTGTRITNTTTPIGGGNSLANVIFNDVYTNNTAAPLIVKYRVIPRGGGCEGDPKTIDFTVKPSPVLLVTPPPAMCSTNSESPSVTNIVLGTDGISVNAEKYRIDLIEYARTPDLSPADPFTTSPSSPLFAFPSSNKQVGDISAAGDIYMIQSDKFRNKTADPFVVRYTITPISAGGCEGVSGTVSIKVRPEPILDPALSPTPICSGDKIDPTGTVFQLKSIPVTSVASTLFIIKSINPNGLTAGTSNTLIGTQIDKDGLDNDIWVNIISSSFVPVVYTIIPISADGCKGEPQTVTININPAPGLKAGLDKLVCNGANSGITLVDNSPVSAAAAQYRLAGVSVVTAGPTYTPITSGATVLGLTANATNRAVGFTGGTSLISADNYTNTTHDRIVVRYEIVAIAAVSGCEATGFVTLTIEPAIESASTIADNDICSGTQIAITFNTPSYANGETTNPALTYSYSMAYVGPQTSGISGNTVGNNLLKDASGVDITDMLINSTDAPIQVKYRITPKAIAAAGGVGGGCTGAVQEIILTVQPRPKINPIADKTICYNTSAGLNLISTTVPSTGVIKFQLTSVVPETAAVTGFSPVNTLFANNAVVGDMLVNSDVVQRYVDYTFEPVNVVDATNTVICANGTPITVRVTVNPRPDVTPSATALEICSSESIEVQLPVNTDPGSTIVKWTIFPAAHADIVGESNGAGDVLFQTLLNNGSVPHVVTYVITPSFNRCDGIPKTVAVTVNPLPKFNTASTPPVLPSRVTVCDGTTFNLNLLTYSTGATTFKWEVTDVNNLGITSTGTGTGIGQPLTNTGDGVATLIYQITPLFVSGSLKQCEGIPRTVTVSVAPKIGGSIEAMDPICEGTDVFMVINLTGQAPFDFDYNTIDVATNTVVANTIITKSGNVKVVKVTPTADTKYEIVNVKDALGCPVTFSTKPSASIKVYKKVTAAFTNTPDDADIPGFKGTSVIQFNNTSTPKDGSVFNYEWTFGTDGYVNPQTSTQVDPAAVTYSRPGDHYVSLRAYNASAPADLGCESTFSKKITIPTLPLAADFEYEPKVACFPQKVKITENNGTGPVSAWEVRDSGGGLVAVSSEVEPEFQMSTPGNYTITLRSYDPFLGLNSGVTSAKKPFTIYDNPVASFDVRPTLVYVPDTELTTFNFTTGAPEYLWDFGDGSTSTEQEPKYTYKIEGIYDIILVAINDHGDGAVCTDTLSRKITAKQGGVTKVPNAFTPSPNGPSGGVAGNNTFNDVFLPIVKGAEEFNMQIFDRWGNLIFESNNSNIGWDGYDKNGKLMPAGVYVYKLTVRLSDGQRSTQLGDITMIR